MERETLFIPQWSTFNKCWVGVPTKEERTRFVIGGGGGVIFRVRKRRFKFHTKFKERDSLCKSKVMILV